MRVFTKILCATDLTDQSDAAIREADRRARLHGAELVVLHALPTMYPGVPMFPHLLERVLVQRERLSSEVIEAILERVATLTGRAPERLGVVIDDGAPDDAILTKADELGIDLIVVGSGRKTTAFGRLVLGSVADRVVRHAHCSVLVARPCQVTKRVLVATDFSEPSALALEVAADETRRRNGRLTVVHSLDVVSPGLALGEPASVPAASLVAYPLSDMRNVVERTLEQAADRLGVTAERVVSNEPPRQAIVHVADSTGADLIVVGTTGRSGLDRILLGSVAEHVMREAPCSVLIVREPTFAAREAPAMPPTGSESRV